MADPRTAWTDPAVTTYQFNNHAVRSEAFRYIRYADGGEEFYDEAADPYEWTNLAGELRVAADKTALARYLPMKNTPSISAKAAGKPNRPAKQAARRARRANASGNP